MAGFRKTLKTNLTILPKIIFFFASYFQTISIIYFYVNYCKESFNLEPIELRKIVMPIIKRNKYVK